MPPHLAEELKLFNLRSSAQSPKVSAQNAYGILRPHLLELLAWRSPVAGQVVDGANCKVILARSLEGKMGALMASGLEDHGLLIIGINAAICQNGRRVDDKNIQMKAASSAAQAEHDNAYGGAAYCSLRYLDLALYALYFFFVFLLHRH
jgi:hypothetical protein